MTQSITPKITITQTGNAQVVIIVPTSTLSSTPAIGMARAGDNQTVVIHD